MLFQRKRIEYERNVREKQPRLRSQPQLSNKTTFYFFTPYFMDCVFNILKDIRQMREAQDYLIGRAKVNGWTEESENAMGKLQGKIQDLREEMMVTPKFLFA